ncbi:hypothetical protein [Mesobacterium hydrothermale]|uniref:hypothetical protein n=1 Tax=Mesobacterium hydrothermale TaxID=3111907 RepID=UPI002DB676CB|nr:hypothetical protein [Mesobacterium sp. TK19101]
MNTLSSTEILSKLKIDRNLHYSALRDPRLRFVKRGNLRVYTLPNLLAVLRDQDWFTPRMESDLIQLDHMKRAEVENA